MEITSQNIEKDGENLPTLLLIATYSIFLLLVAICFRSNLHGPAKMEQNEGSAEEEELVEEEVLVETPLDKITKKNTEFNKRVGKSLSEDDKIVQIKDENINVFQRKYVKPKINKLPKLLDISAANSVEDHFSFS